MVSQARAFLQKSKSDPGNHVATLIHASRARILAAAASPATEDSRSIVGEAAQIEAAAASILKHKQKSGGASTNKPAEMFNKPQQVFNGPSSAVSGFTPLADI